MARSRRPRPDSRTASPRQTPPRSGIGTRGWKPRPISDVPTPQPMPPPSPSPKWVCGPDVTQQVTAVWQKIKDDFAALTFLQKIYACNSIFLPFQKPDATLENILELIKPEVSLESLKNRAQMFADINSWDTLPLYRGFSGWLRKPPIYDAKTKGPCATPSSDIFPAANQDDNNDPLHESPDCCANSVQVGGKCWLNGTANYGTFGVMVRACQDFTTSNPLLKSTPLTKVYSLEWAIMLIRAYKRFGSEPEDPRCRSPGPKPPITADRRRFRVWEAIGRNATADADARGTLFRFPGITSGLHTRCVPRPSPGGRCGR